MRTCRIVNFTVPTDHGVKLKESEKKAKYVDLARESKTKEHESDGDNNCNWLSWCNQKKIGTRTWGFGNKRRSGDHPNYSTVEISQNTEKIPGELRRLAVIQTQVKNHRLTLVWKTRKGVNNNSDKNNHYGGFETWTDTTPLLSKKDFKCSLVKLSLSFFNMFTVFLLSAYWSHQTYVSPHSSWSPGLKCRIFNLLFNGLIICIIAWQQRYINGNFLPEFSPHKYICTSRYQYRCALRGFYKIIRVNKITEMFFSMISNNEISFHLYILLFFSLGQSKIKKLSQALISRKCQ